MVWRTLFFNIYLQGYSPEASSPADNNAALTYTKSWNLMPRFSVRLLSLDKPENVRIISM